ncbi:FK506 suppressor Sfk1 [Pyrenophora tritici-repentis]|nr:Frag1 multi-domain protein [Pyrenophora tritici-repentis]KAI1518886.1 FK506 suppressor Sfk1 [Pyrenophora tritici-repentis]KAI1525718.1 FK506 suppressor Sfk1 [Pyrenophora tritici-repentis]KAI1533043.1 FK506 suppressor Sfk1 [Pyrenophora tritici-repentis]KAI1561787.1 FK506 suppressor Sfk1 [Pyrenophora tritici-repentis]
MSQGQTIPYISDIGADYLKAMFIAMSAVTVVTFDFAFISERWLRHSAKLAPNTSHWQKIYSICATVAAIIGAAGLILLTIFDCKNHNRLHNIFLAVFIIAYIISAIFICWEYQRLGIHYREHSVLRISFWIKLFFIITEICLAVSFAVCSKKHLYNTAAILEWIVSFIYCLYVFSFFIDFLPATRTKNHQSKQTEMQAFEEGRQPAQSHMGDGAADSQQYYRGNSQMAVPQANGYTNGIGHTNGATNGYVSHTANGYPTPAQDPTLPSRNF